MFLAPNFLGANFLVPIMWRSFAVIGRGSSEITRWKNKKHHEHFISPPVTPYGRPNNQPVGKYELPPERNWFKDVFSLLRFETFFGPENGSQWPRMLFFLSFFSVLLYDFPSTKAFSFHNRSSSKYAHILVPRVSTIAASRIFNLRSN